MTIIAPAEGAADIMPPLAAGIADGWTATVSCISTVAEIGEDTETSASSWPVPFVMTK
jgi:hypothetical protein